MAQEVPIYPLLAGDVYFAVLDANDNEQGFTQLGNFTVKLKQNSDEKTLPSVMTANYGDAVAQVYVKQPPEVTLEGEGITSDLLALIFGGAVTAGTVTGSTASESVTVYALDKSVNLTKNDVSLIAIALAANTAQDATTQDTGDTVTDSAHGLNNGDLVILTELVTTTGVSINTPYYVVNKATNTFQLSLTAGGAAITLTTDGTAKYRLCVPTTNYELENAKLGLVAILSGGVIAANDVVDIYYTYASKTWKTIASGSKASVNVALKAALDDQNTGELWTLNIPKITVTSNSEIQLIGTDFVKASLTGKPISVNNAPAFTLYKDVA